jgi:gas vesicle protein
MCKSGKLMFGFVSFFAAGAIVGMLYAPDKGERTRRRVVRRSKGLYSSVKDTIDESKDALQELQDRLKENLEIVNEEMEKLSKR